ncbi:MAG: precorrin-6y C5,15-methyltransferase (decarboxylating) subunit CbiE [Massiliimalia sp.]|jgi:precorrin-6Y C5,15-methyltransferase (decarboxylating)
MKKQTVFVVGIGMGNPDTMTREAYQAVESAQALVGAARMLEPFAHLEKPSFTSYRPGEIADWIASHSEYETVAVLQSGDVGFYSGAKRLYDALSDFSVKAIPGISSMAYLCSRIPTSWDDVFWVSLHGRQAGWLGEIASRPKVFLLAGGDPTPEQIIEMLEQNGLSQVTVWVGENLSYSNERITCGKPGELAGRQFDKLSVLLIVNPNPVTAGTAPVGLEDDAFVRGDVPMTKSEVRAVTLSKLQMQSDDIVYDVGAGTGSVSVEMALCARGGQVYAIERKPEAAQLIRKNREQFGLPHLQVVEGLAPQALEPLPPPDKVFLGGTAGNMEEIFRVVLGKNPRARIVVNAIALESLNEAVQCFEKFQMKQVEIAQVTVAKSRQVGKYHMMTGQNPIYIISGNGGDEQ